MIKILEPENWQNKQKILVILAHPDDPEFFCGGTLARWIDAGHEVNYLLLTRGDKGASDPSITPEALIKKRMDEQRRAGDILGVKDINFLSQPDGYLIPSLDIRKEVVRHIRKIQPSIMVTCDPLSFYNRGININHPDHRAAGQIALEAVFPAAGNIFYFPDLLKEGLQPHSPAEVWVSLSREPDVVIDVTPFWQKKLDALLQHGSQIGDPPQFLEKMATRKTIDSSSDNPRFEEGFKRLFQR